MSSVCISRCVDDTQAPSRTRATYVNLHRWPESDAEFVRSLSFRSTSEGGSSGAAPKVVDCISCRQMYLRSYTFTRKETMNQRTKKCIGKVKEKVVVNGRRVKLKEVPCAALKSLFRKLLFCSASVDVVLDVSD